MRPRIFTPYGIAVAVVAAAIVAPGGSLAASSSGGFSVRGIGAQSCKQISAVQGEAETAAIIDLVGAWGAGYVSQLNRATVNNYEAIPIIDNGVIARIVVNVCKSNPDALVESVFANLVQSFLPAAQTEESPLVEITNGAQKTVLRQRVLRKVQEVLVGQGRLPSGSADGQYGPRTRDAITVFQKARSLPETGIPDAATLISMFVRASS